MATRTEELRIASLFAGVGGLDLGVRDALFRLGAARTSEFVGATPRHVVYVEREVYAARVLAARMADGRVEPARIWSDVVTIPDEIKADLCIGGFPCQDLSVAGNVAGIRGERSGLFFDMLDEESRTWMTPAGMAGTDKSGKPGAGGEFAAMAKKWTTPTTGDVHQRKDKYAQGGTPLSLQACSLPDQETPDGRASSKNIPSERRPLLYRQVLDSYAPQRREDHPSWQRAYPRKLNPGFVAWLMGFPIGWTSLEPLETP